MVMRGKHWGMHWATKLRVKYYQGVMCKAGICAGGMACAHQRGMPGEQGRRGDGLDVLGAITTGLLRARESVRNASFTAYLSLFPNPKLVGKGTRGVHALLGMDTHAVG